MHILFLVSGFPKFSLTENRLVYERQSSMRKRLETIYGANEGLPSSGAALRRTLLDNASREARKVVEQPFGGRADAPPIDEEYATQLAQEAAERFLRGETLRKDPEVQRIMKKAIALMQLYPDRNGLEGLKFGWKGGLVVQNLDPERQKWAMREIADQIAYLQKKKEPYADIEQYRGETKEDFERRAAAVRRYNMENNLQDEGYVNQQVRDWQHILGTISEFNSDFNRYKEIVEELQNNPESFLSIEAKYGKDVLVKWGQKYPTLYRKVIRDAAKADASVLIGRESLFGAEGLKNIIIDILEANPLVLEHYPKNLKDTQEYRDVMMKAAAKDGRIVQLAINEYEEFWKGKVVGNGDSESDAFTELLHVAVNKEPFMLFGFQGSRNWRELEDFDKASEFSAFVKSLDLEAKIGILKILTERNIDKLNDYDGENGRGALGFCFDVLLSGDGLNTDALRVIAKNRFLFERIKATDEDMYKKMLEKLGGIQDADIAQLLEEEHVSVDEDLSKGVLDTMYAAIVEEKNPQNAAAAVRKYRDQLKNIPRHIFFTEKFQKQILAIFGKQGELFEYAPDDWKEDKDICLLVLLQNASAFRYVSNDLKNDAELVYAAMIAEEEGSGNMHWNDVGAVLKARLAYLGDMEGIPTTDRLMRFILGIKEDENFTADSVHSLMDKWPDSMKKNKDFVRRYLKKHLNPSDRENFRPEYFLDAAQEFRSDIDFVGEMMNTEEDNDKNRGNPMVFKHLGDVLVKDGKVLTLDDLKNGTPADAVSVNLHEHFWQNNTEKYMNLVEQAVRYDSSVMKGLPDTLRNDAEFLVAVYLRTGRVDIFKEVKEEKLTDVDFVISIMKEMVTRSAPSSHITQFFSYLPKEPTLLRELLAQSDGKLLSILLTDPRLFISFPSNAYTADILTTVIQRVLESGRFTIAEWNWEFVVSLLRKASDAERHTFLSERPDFVRSLLQKNVSAISLLDESLITVDLLRDIVDDVPLNSLFNAVFSKKPNVLVGLIRSDVTIWKRLDATQRIKLRKEMDIDTLEMLAETMAELEQEEKVEKQSERLDALRQVRAKVIYYQKVLEDTVLIKWPGWSAKSDGAPISYFVKWLEDPFIPNPPQNVMRYFDVSKYLNDEDPNTVVTYEDVAKLQKLYETLLTAIESQVDLSTIDPQKFSESIDDTTALSNSVLAPKYRKDTQVIHLEILRKFITTKQHEISTKPDGTKRDLADKQKAEANLEALKETYLTQLTSHMDRLQNINALLALNPSDPTSKEAIALRIKSITDFLDSDGTTIVAALQKEMSLDRFVIKVEILNRKLRALHQVKDSLVTHMRSNERLRAQTEGTEDYYNLSPVSVEFVNKAQDILGINAFGLARVLTQELQGQPNTTEVFTRDYLSLFKTDADWMKVRSVIASIGIEFPTEETEYTVTHLHQLADALMLAKEQHAIAIIHAIKNNAFEKSTMGFPQTQERTLTPENLRQYRSMIVMVSRELGAGGFSSERMVEKWQEIRKRQWEAFANSPDIQDKKPKAVDVFVIAEQDGPKGAVSYYLQNIEKMLAGFNSRLSNNEDAGSVVAEHRVANREQFMQKMQEFQAKQKEYKDNDRHLVLYIGTHGRGRSGNSLETDLDDVAAMIDPQASTLLYSSCFGGKHLMEMARKDPESFKSNVYTGVHSTLDSLNVREHMGALLQQAFTASDVDYNEDGVVSLAEAFYWVDQNTNYQDVTGVGPGGVPLVNLDQPSEDIVA